MKILFVCKCSPWQVGGAETHTREVAIELVKQGHEITILCAKTMVNELSQQDIAGVSIITKQVMPNFLLSKYPHPHYLSGALSNLLLAFYLLLHLNTKRYDLIREDLAPFPPSGFLAFIRLPSTQRYAVVHSHPPTQTEWIELYGLLYGVLGYAMSLALQKGFLQYDQIICTAPWMFDGLKNQPKLISKVRWVPSGIDYTRFEPGITSHKAPWTLSHFTLLSIGRLVEIKGHRYLIEALPKLLIDFPEITLKIIGDGILRKNLQKLSHQLGVSHHVQFVAWISESELLAIYHNSDFLVMPSISEGVPITILEAMASGIPIIASDLSGIRGALNEESALFFEPRNVQDIADKLRWAFNNLGAMQCRADKASQLVKNYSWYITAQKEVLG